MIAIIGAAALALQAAAAPAWTWSLYEGEGPLVLANDAPDTAFLRATLECDPGSGVAHVSIYGEPSAASGFATVRSGAASAATQAATGRAGQWETAVRTDHPVFAAFIETGALAVSVGDQQRSVRVQRPHLAKLRRFAELCGG